MTPVRLESITLRSRVKHSTTEPLRSCRIMVNVLKFRTLFLFLFSYKMLVLRSGINKMLNRIANREDPDQTASSEAV